MSTEPLPAVSVVIPALNAARTLTDQLSALSTQELSEPWEVIVVDNGSTDGTTQLLYRWAERLPSMRVVTCDRRGANSARNAGVRAARGERILCCDADDVVSAGWLRRLSSALDQWDLVGGVTETTSLNDALVRRSRANPASDSLPKGLGFLPYALGSNMGFTRRLFDEIGGFDEAFLLGADEIDFSWRAQYAGFRLGFVSDALVHYRFRSRPRDAVRQAFYTARGSAQLYAKHRKLGTLPRRPARRQLRSAGRRLRALARVYRIVSPEHRLPYARNLGRALGVAAGFARYRIVA
jgi:glycosyltransferase involved in cell wall biosynthesis